jgi:hypothetical protein
MPTWTPQEQRFAAALGALALAGERAESCRFGFGLYPGADKATQVRNVRAQLLGQWARSRADEQERLADTAERVAAYFLRRNAPPPPRKTATGDAITVYAAQRNETAKTFGLTKTDVPGAPTRGEPNLSLEYARRMVDYWSLAGTRTANDMTAISSAHTERFLRDVYALGRWFDHLNALPGKPADLLTEEDAVKTWRLTESVVHALGAINQTPGAWDLLVEAFEESARDLFPPAEDWALYLKIAAGALAAIAVIQVLK